MRVCNIINSREIIVEYSVILPSYSNNSAISSSPMHVLDLNQQFERKAIILCLNWFKTNYSDNWQEHFDEVDFTIYTLSELHNFLTDFYDKFDHLNIEIRDVEEILTVE